MQPRKRFLGGVTAALVLFALIVSCGHVALAYGGNTAGELVFSGSTENVQFSFDSVNWRTAKGYQERYCSDESALMKYIAGLHLYRITGNYSFPVENNQLTIIYRGPEGTFGVDLRDRVLTVPHCPERLFAIPATTSTIGSIGATSNRCSVPKFLHPILPT
jgi:hypothetical protein